MKLFQIKKIRFSIMLSAVGLAMVATRASAAIIHNDFNGTPLTFTMGMTLLEYGDQNKDELFYIDLPGDARIVGTRFSFNERNFFDVYRIGGHVEFVRNWHNSLAYAEALAAGESWSDHSGSSVGTWGNISRLDPDTGDAFLPRDYPTYIPFRFLDTTDSDAAKFGYMKISSVLSGSGDDTVLTWNIYEYAYESNAQEEIFMGVVPEPSTVLTLVLGALVLIGYRRARL